MGQRLKMSIHLYDIKHFIQSGYKLDFEASKFIEDRVIRIATVHQMAVIHMMAHTRYGGATTLCADLSR